ncbi:MAG: ABC transporter substrate-binding protein [Acidimicrobiia bacterium]|nr:ABC transporter substrate-binding protein [Acidimicrobiia bacterium]MCY4432036.1 ABC transporter substrate-binding protein [bacterium]
MKRWWWLLVALALVAAACGGNDDDGAADTAEPAAAEEQTAAPAEAPSEAPAEEPGEAPLEAPAEEPAEQPAEEPDEAPAEPTPDPTPIVLSASYQGVTESEIAIGAAVIDLDQLVSFGIDLSPFPLENYYSALADDLNERGGIHGRNVVVHVSLFLPIGAADSERVCTELMEDKRVFVVIGQFLEDYALCITELHGHPYVGHFGENAERQARSNGLFFATEMNQTRMRVGGVVEMIRAGDLDGHNVGIYYEAPPDKEYADAVEPLLEEASINVVGVYPRGAPTNDTVANEQATDSIAQRMRADGVDLILNLSNVHGIIQGAQRLGWDVRIALTNGQAADRSTISEDLSLGDEVLSRTFAVTADKPGPEESLADPGVQKCIAAYQERFGGEPLDLTDTEVVGSATNHCRAFVLTVRILEAAGGNITPETFVAAAEGLGTFDLPAMAGATISPEQHSAGSQVRRYEYFPEENSWLPVGEPIQTENVG